MRRPFCMNDGYGGFVEHFWICFVAAVIDGLVILLLDVLLNLVYQDLYWPRRNRKTRVCCCCFNWGCPCDRLQTVGP